MKKKIYIQPNVTIVTVGPQIMIAISNTNVVGLGYRGDTEGMVTSGDTKYNDYDVWDEE